MKNRIRYTKSQDKQLLTSSNVFHHPTNGARYRVNVSLVKLTWSIVDDASQLVAVEGTGKHPHKLKIAAREALEGLGIVLNREERDRKIKTNLV